MNKIGNWYHPGPYEYTREWDFLIDFKTDGDVARQFLPEVLDMDPETRAWFRVSHHKSSSFGPYIGVYLGLYAVDQGVPVRYILTGLKTDFMGTIAAREIWGFPYGLGKVEAGWNGSTFSCAVWGSTGEKHAQVYLQTTSKQTEANPGVGARYTKQVRDFAGNVGKTQLLRAKNAYSLGEADAWDASASLKLEQGTAIDDWSVVPVHEVVHAEFRTGGSSSLGMAEVVTEW